MGKPFLKTYAQYTIDSMQQFDPYLLTILYCMKLGSRIQILHGVLQAIPGPVETCHTKFDRGSPESDVRRIHTNLHTTSLNVRTRTFRPTDLICQYSERTWDDDCLKPYSPDPKP